MRISSPSFISPCYYGTDIDTKENLVACNYSLTEIADLIGADSLGYLPLDSLSELVGHTGYCHACFSGDYATPVPDVVSKERFEKPLSELPEKESRRKE